MGKVKVFFEKHSAGIIFMTDFVAFIFSSIDHERINIGILRKIVYSLNCFQFELLLILCFFFIFIVYRFVKFRFAKATMFTRITAVCCLSFVLIQSSSSIWHYAQNRIFYIREKLFMADMQAIPIKKGTEAFRDCRYMEAQEQFEEALALVNNSSYAYEINAYMNRIQDYKELAAYIFSIYQHQPKTPERIAALLYCTSLDDNDLYRQAYDADQQEVVHCIREYPSFYEACKLGDQKMCSHFIRKNGWCYFEKEMIEEVLSKKYVDIRFLIRAVLAESMEDNIERLKKVWMIKEDIRTYADHEMLLDSL